MSYDNEMSKRSGYEDALKGMTMKQNESSWYYQGYIDGQLEIMEHHATKMDRDIKILEKLVSDYVKG